MVQITVHLYTILQRQTPDGPQRQLEVTLPPGSTIADLIKTLGITLPEEAMLVVMNGRHTTTAHILQPHDHVHLMPAMSGG
ncbi:MAG: MoaD/ThiS family protein [Anaerolineae bacterium]|nr:MoaD/ThiS family protein [Anaerolineae bacterium]